MSDNVQFGDDQGDTVESSYVSRQVLGEPVKPGMIGLIKKMKIAKSDAQAYYILIGTAGVCLIATILITLFFIIGIGPKQPPTIRATKDAKAALPQSVQDRIQAAQQKKK